MKQRRIFGKTLLTLLTVGVAAVLLLALLPKPPLYSGVTFSSAIVSRDGELLRLTLAADDRYRLRTPLGSIAPSAVDATLLYEDRHFRQHPGFNPFAIVRAGWSTWVSGERSMGASTITMQLARIRFRIDSSSVAGKLLQIGRAIQLERHYSKTDILEAYLNLAPYGGNVEGIATASQVYFGKPATELSVAEALSLAVIPQNPVARNPVDARPEWYEARQRLLQQWQHAYGLDKETAQQFDLPLAVRSPSMLPFVAPHLVQHIAQQQPGERVATTIDLGLQRLLRETVQGYVARRQSSAMHNASAMLLDTETMQVLARVGSADFFDDAIEGQVDGTRARRSPGSTLKPFVYGMALDRGLIHPMSLLKDAPRRFAAYTPENFDRGFLGPVTAQDALVYSRNVPAIELLLQVGHDQFHQFLADATVANLADADHYGLAMVLGGIELSMEELLQLYAMLANGGVLQPLQQTMSQTGAAGQRLLSPEAAWLVLDMLQKNPRPGALDLDAEDAVIAWKTGTSYAYRDAWTVGVFGRYALAVWVGNFDGSGNPAFVGRQAAAPLFLQIADALIAQDPDAGAARLPGPELNLQKVEVCADTGDLPGRYCPRTERAWFIPGVSPIRVSDVHRAVRVDRDTGLRSCATADDNTYLEVYEFWPSDISQLLQQAGIAVRKPPAWSPGCSLQQLATTGNRPRIASLSSQLLYPLRPEQERRLPLTATTDADASHLYWFVDDAFVGKTARDEALFWNASAGTHNVLAVDDMGRSDSLQLTVAASH